MNQDAGQRKKGRRIFIPRPNYSLALSSLTFMLQAYQADLLHFLVPEVQKQCIPRFHEGLSRPDLKSRYHKS